MAYFYSTDERKAVLSLWYGWMVSTGAIMCIAVLSLWLTRIWLPIISFIMAAGLFMIVRRNNSSENPRCYVTPYLTCSVVTICGIILTVIDVLNTPRLIPDPWIDSRSGVLPYLGALVSYPVAALYFIFATVRRYRLGYCVDCRMRYGTPAERGLIGVFYSQESMFQRRFMAVTCSAMSIVCWAYYLFAYINVSLTNADIYVFFVLPALLFLCTSIYMGGRYFTIYYYYDRDMSGAFNSWTDSTIVRYIVICGDRILLHVPDSSADSMSFDDKIDTPAILRFGFREQVGSREARNWFFNMNHIPLNAETRERIEVRFMYSGKSASPRSNLFHFLVFAQSPEEAEGGSIKGKWFTIHEINRLIREGRCNSLLAAELKRLHTIAMAWKTYDRKGHRLYKIKNYTPSFRVQDIKKWDVDYNDPHWLYISINNEDKPFYRIRQLWRRFVAGISD